MSPFSLSIVSGSYIQAALGGGLADAFVRHVRSARERIGTIFFCFSPNCFQPASKSTSAAWGRTGGRICPTCPRCAGAHRKGFLLLTFLFLKKKSKRES